MGCTDVGENVNEGTEMANQTHRNISQEMDLSVAAEDRSRSDTNIDACVDGIDGDMIDGVSVNARFIEVLPEDDVQTQIQQQDTQYGTRDENDHVTHNTSTLKDLFGRCCQKQCAEDDGVHARALPLTVAGELFGASLKSIQQENGRYDHYFIMYDKHPDGVAKSLHIRHNDNLLLFRDIEVTNKDQASVMKMFQDIQRDSEKFIILVICRNKGRSKKVIKIKFSLIFTDDIVICEVVNKVQMRSSASTGVVAVDLHHRPHDVTGRIRCGHTIRPTFARIKHGQLISQALINPDASFEFSQIVYSATSVDKTSMFGVRLTSVCMFKSRSTDLCITVNPDTTIALTRGKLATQMEVLTKKEGRFFYIHKFGSTMYLESTAHGRHFLCHDAGVFTLEYCNNINELQSLYRNRTDFRFFEMKDNSDNDRADDNKDDHVSLVLSIFQGFMRLFSSR